MTGPLADIVRLLQDHGIEAAPVPVEQIALDCGLHVVRSAADASQGGFLLRAETSLVGVNSRLSTARQRFVIAHELGHWILGHEGPLLVCQSMLEIRKRSGVASQASHEQEVEANRFAGDLLMPAGFVADMVDLMCVQGKDRDVVVRAVMEVFEVSHDTAICRLFDLGVLSN